MSKWTIAGAALLLPLASALARDGTGTSDPVVAARVAPADGDVQSTSSTLADSLPADAILYAELDTRRIVDGELGLDLVRLLDEPQVQEFVKPLASEMPQLSTQGLRQWIDSIPWRDYVDGRVEFGAAGLRAEVDGQVFEVSAAHPIDARLVNRIIGMAAKEASSKASAKNHDVSIQLDFVLSFEAGSSFGDLFEQHVTKLRSGEGRHAIKSLREESAPIAGHPARKFSLAFGSGDHEPSFTIWQIQDGRHWWIGGNPATLERCIRGASGPSLARSQSFQNLRRQVTESQPGMFAYLNVANLLTPFKNLVAPIVQEELDLFGITSVDAVGYASSFVAGGVRDTLALSFSKPPTGLVSLLTSGEGGLRFLQKAPAETGLYFGEKFDPQGFVDRLTTVLDQLFPGSGAAVERGLAEASRAAGMDVRQQILPAVGNELGLYLTAPGAGSFVPQGLLLLKIGDRERFEKLLAIGMEQAGAHGGLRFTEMKSMPAGVHAWTVTIEGAPVQPAIAVTNDVLAVAVDSLYLKKALRDLETGVAHSVMENANFQKTLTGLTGKPDAQGLCLLGFLDLGRAVEIGYQYTPLVAGEISRSTGGKLDTSALPEADAIARHFSGIGVAGRADERGLSLTFFTPTGLTTLAAVGGALAMGRANVELARSLHDVDSRARAAPAVATPAGGAFLGVVIAQGNGASDGAEVTSVQADSGAERAGVKSGDRIVTLNGSSVADGDGLRALLGGCKPGDVVKLTVLRDGARVKLAATLGARGETTVAPAAATTHPAAKAAESKSAPAVGRRRPLSELFTNIERATGATIDYPDEIATVEVEYTPRSADLETLMSELSKLAGFHYKMHDVDGGKLVVVAKN